MNYSNSGENIALTGCERDSIRKVCDLTKYYFMERYLLSLSAFSENLIYTMVNDMDKFFTDSNAEVLNKAYAETLKKHGVADEQILDNLIIKRSSFEKFADCLNFEIQALVESGQDVDISSDSKKIFSDLGYSAYANSVLDRSLQNNGIPNNSSILDCCRIAISRDKNGDLKTSASRVVFPVETNEEMSEDVSDLIHNYFKAKSAIKFLEIPLEDCYGKYFEHENDGMGTN